jgi:N-acetylneuraminic acid mutarotase
VARFLVVLVALGVVGVASGATPPWRAATPVPVPRTEVAAARLGQEIAVVGGFTVDGATTARADAYSPSADRWRRLPDLPVAVNHAAAASYRGRLYVFGGFAANGRVLRTAFALVGGSWRRLRSLPQGRGAAGAAVARGRLYVVGGRAPTGLARRAFAYDPARGRWTSIPGPTPREHLAAAARAGLVYAVAGRKFGYDTNVRTFEAYDPARRRWRRLRPVPAARGGTAAAAVGRTILSVGGEAPSGTISAVYGYDVLARRWRRLPDLPTPRHGLGLVVAGSRAYALAGGPEPGLHVSGANEYLTLG